MMPLIVKDFSWHQTPTTVSIVVIIPGIIPSKTDVLTANNYVRIHCHPHIFEAFLWGTVDDEQGTCIMDKDKGTVLLNFNKTPSTPPNNLSADAHTNTDNDETSNWPTLEAQGLDRMKKKVLRDTAVKTAHERYVKEAQSSASRREELRQTSVLEQIRMDEEARAKVAIIKKTEADRALADMNKWAAEGKLLPGETMSRVILPHPQSLNDQVTNKPGGGATADRLARNRPTLRAKPKGKETLEELIAQGPSQVSILSSNKNDDDVDVTRLVGAECLKQCPTTAYKTPSKSSELGGSRTDVGSGDHKNAVGVRQPQRITVAFTPREFPTPARESSAPLEEEWLKKQADARHLSGFNEPDLRPEERDPDWLLQKGQSLMKTDCHLGAVSAFSLGIKLAPKIPDLYAERAKAHFQLQNFMKAVDDSSYALELFTPKVLSNVIDRLKCHLIRADSFHALQMDRESLNDLKEALRLTPDDEELQNRVHKVSASVDNLTNSDPE